MSYQVIARKWRPQTFDEVTGQEHITQTLRNALAHDRLHHAYLFSGARGVGKTTTARLLAKALNCHKTDKPNLNPCRYGDPTACPSCVEISESRSMDVLEIDAASHTGIDDVRETILESININPVRDRYKVFIVDEVHQLSKPAFNALLKTLEEPPANVVFVMATTELHKVPETIRSRCQEFDFRTIALQKIFDRLGLIAKAEKITVDDAALREIARSGMGSMRDAQSNFDQVISFSGENISIQDVSNALGIASTDMMVRVLSSISDASPKLILDVVAELVSRGQDARNFCRDLLAVFRDLMVFNVSGGETGLVETSALSPDELKEYSDRFTASDLVRFFNSLCETEAKLKEAVQPRYVLETGLVKLTEMRRIVPIEQLLERLAQLENAIGETPTSSAESSFAATAEKKTLIFEPAGPEEEPPDISARFELAGEPVFENNDPLPEPPPEFIPEPPRAPAIDLSFIDSLPVKLAPIESEALEHVEDAWLDSAYELKLARSGDDLLPILAAASLAENLFGKVAGEPASHHAANGSNGTAAAPALSAVFVPPDLDPVDEEYEPVNLPPNASKEELLAYASNHPLAKKAMRIFRAKIVDVK
ncbi:MAG TPA: DNA polymerase III subunit gamma/tau, partial [Pyrinomonadaceae bacterium]|nr:DNA polymerase III subunit gamma/tau [Pyrinomonadaceae bacterium]